MSDWYDIVDADSPLDQGDLVFDCPLLEWNIDNTDFASAENEQSLQAAVEAIRCDIIIMTQACDLAQSHVRDVIVCPHWSLSHYKEDWEATMESNGQTPTPKAWSKQCEEIKRGAKWDSAMLDGCSRVEHPMEHRIVQFQPIYSLPRPFLENLLSARATPRLRLCAPYREHLSQSFARYFMRVGLPTPIDPVW